MTMQPFTTGYYNKFGSTRSSILQSINPMNMIEENAQQKLKRELEENALKRALKKEKKDKEELLKTQLREDKNKFQLKHDKEEVRKTLNDLIKNVEKESFKPVLIKEPSITTKEEFQKK